MLQQLRTPPMPGLRSCSSRLARHGQKWGTTARSGLAFGNETAAVWARFGIQAIMYRQAQRGAGACAASCMCHHPAVLDSASKGTVRTPWLRAAVRGRVFGIPSYHVQKVFSEVLGVRYASTQAASDMSLVHTERVAAGTTCQDEACTHLALKVSLLYCSSLSYLAGKACLSGMRPVRMWPSR